MPQDPIIDPPVVEPTPIRPISPELPPGPPYLCAECPEHEPFKNLGGYRLHRSVRHGEKGAKATAAKKKTSKPRAKKEPELAELVQVLHTRPDGTLIMLAADESIWAVRRIGA